MWRCHSSSRTVSLPFNSFWNQAPIPLPGTQIEPHLPPTSVLSCPASLQPCPPFAFPRTGNAGSHFTHTLFSLPKAPPSLSTTPSRLQPRLQTPSQAPSRTSGPSLLLHSLPLHPATLVPIFLVHCVPSHCRGARGFSLFSFPQHHTWQINGY